jgi:site-specific DNA-methyltransferase (adenine-specific)
MNEEIIQGNCLEVMKEMAENSVDLIILDPPYNLSIDKWDRFTSEKYITLLEKTSNECKRILKDTGSLWCFSGWSSVEVVRQQFCRNFKLRNWIIWDRIKGRGAKYNLVSTREDILWFTKSDKYVFNKQSSSIKKVTKGMGLKNGDDCRKLSNVWTDISPIVPWSTQRVEHPTQKPEKLIERIIKISSNEGDMILDPFAGSGTTGMACKNLGRNYLLIEKEPEYIEIIKERLRSATITREHLQTNIEEQGK